MVAADDSAITKAIKLAAVAGSLRFWARQRPDAAAGLNKAADAYTCRSKAALEEATRLSTPMLGLRLLGK